MTELAASQKADPAELAALRDADDTVDALVAIYDWIRDNTGDPAQRVPLADLRRTMHATDGPAADRFTAAVTKLADLHGVHVRAEADRKTLTAEDHAGAVHLGGTARHHLLIVR